MDNEQKLIKNPETPLELAETCIKILDNRRARNMKLLRVDEKTIIADYFIICSGNSNTQIRALANELDFKLSPLGLVPLHSDGLPEATWVVLDYGSVMIHIFNSETREFYNLEKLWQDAEEIDITNLLTED